jgi:hypothetical protein
MLLKPAIKIRQSGSAMILTMFILAGMLIVAISGSYLVMIGIKAGGIQAQSTKAYFAAESGVEDILWQIRSSNLLHGRKGRPQSLINGALTPEDTYEVFFFTDDKYIYTSIGDSRNTKRSVEVSW